LSSWGALERKTSWTIQQQLFTRHALFSFRAAPGRRLNCAWFGLPEGKQPVNENDTFKLDVENIPGFEQEEYMPPEEALKGRVDFFYIYSLPKGADTKTSDWFWKDEANKQGKNLEKFIERHKGVDRAEAEATAANDPPEAKLRKLYARVQQIHNLSFDREKTEKEENREKIKDSFNIDDVLKHGYGHGNEINTLFAAMARAAGFDAFLVLVATRDTMFLRPTVLDFSQLTGNVVEVKVGKTVQFFDPATLYCPFGLLPWEESGARGIELKDGGSEFVKTTDLVSSDAVIERNATLQLALDREVQGEVDLKYVGQEALSRRLENRDVDEAARRKYLEDEMKGWLPSGSTVELEGDPNWWKSEEDLHAEFNVKIPIVGTPTGKRLLLTPTISEINETYPFKSEKRTYPVYFHFPYQVVDDVTLQVPQGLQVESLPKPKNLQTPLGQYDISYEAHGGTVHVARHLVMDGIFNPVEYYPALRSIFVAARAGDEQQMVLTTSVSAGNN
jgi:Transglutaminase-like superfamily